MNMPTEAKRPESPSAVYEEMYAHDDLTYESPRSSPYYPLFVAAVKALRASGGHSVLEVGCGSGTLAQMVIEQGLEYRGFDYAHTGIEKARKRNPGANFAWGDATTAAPYAQAYDTILCCEVLEHVDRDLDVIRQWQPGSKIVCSVPNYDYQTHVRFFRSEEEVRRRYEDLISFNTIQRLAMSPSAGLTAREYLRRVRWAREDGWRRVLGVLGINAFDWSGGWFLFTGVRR